MKLVLHLFFYCLILSIYIYSMLLTRPRLWLHRMPPAVRTRVSPRNSHETRLFLAAGIPLMLIFLFYPLVFTWLHCDSLVHIMASLLCFTLGFTLWDTVVLDLWIFCRVTPESMVIEGTDREDYRDTGYHIQAGIRGIALSAAYSLIAGIAIFLAKTHPG